MSEFSGYGFAAGSVIGLRSFRVDHLGRLTGVTIKQVWTPGENEATCRKPQDPYGGHLTQYISRVLTPSPTYRISLNTGDPGGATLRYPEAVMTVDPMPKVTPTHEVATCTCGFYAYFDGGNDYADSTTLAGVVEGYGKTTIGTRGFRAEKARLLALVIPATPRKGQPGRLKGTDLRPLLLDRVRRNYPEVAVFDTQHAMTTEYPTTDEAITPETDEQFWSREALT